MSDILIALPSNPPNPNVLASGVVGQYYPTVNNGNGIFTMMGSPNPFACPQYPFSYEVISGIKPYGLNFIYPSPLSNPPNCPLYPPTTGPGINEFDLDGVPLVAGIFNFTIRFKTAQYPGFGTSTDRNYRIEILPEPGYCCADVLLSKLIPTEYLPDPILNLQPGKVLNLKYKIGAMVITDVSFSPINNPIFLGDIQSAINNDPIYQNFQATMGGSITLVSWDTNGLKATICKRSNFPITDNAEGTFVVTSV